MSLIGFDELSKKLNQLAQNAQELGETKSASLTEILSPEFMSQHTRFANVGELFEAGGFDASSQSAFEAIPQDQLDAFVRSESSFDSWKEMLNTAGAAWAKGKLGL